MEGRPEQLVVHTVMLRSLQHARYDAQPLGHFGLAVQLYTHFTAPIRRYPDLIVHRVLWETMARGQLSNKHKAKLEQLMPYYAFHSSERERLAEEAERETVELKQVEYIRKFIGEVFDAIVVGITNFGMFVALPNGIEGLVHVSSITDDYYLFNERNYTLMGEHAKKIFASVIKLRCSWYGPALKTGRSILNWLRNSGWSWVVSSWWLVVGR